MAQEKKKSNLQPFLWTLLVISLLLNGYLWYSKSQISKKSDQQQIEIDEATQLNAQLEKQYYEAMADLEEMRGDNEELNALIDSQKSELTQHKNRIAALISERNDLKTAKEELAQLKTTVEGYVTEIEKLQEENQQLLVQNEELQENNESLKEEMSQEKMMNDELTTAKAALVSDMEELSEHNKRLSKKVDRASLVEVENIDVTGIGTRNNGKEVSRRRAKDVERLEVCFEVTENLIADPGIEQFFVRIISPVGETMAIENMGSGVLFKAETEEQIQYTQLKGIKYENQPAETCLSWAPGIPFESGEYQIEVYNKGFLAGNSTFELK